MLKYTVSTILLQLNAEGSNQLFINLKQEQMKKTHKVVMLPIQEEWKDIKEYEGRYQISNYGKVKSLAREVPRTYRPYSVEERLLVITIDNNGRQVVGLTTNGKTMNKYVHRLVAQAFIPNPLNKPEVNHLDFDKLNNNIQNLEWVTEKENIQHSYDMRNKFMGLRNNSHLYIVSNDEIKEGDWQYTRLHGITQAKNLLWSEQEGAKKVVATTDKSLYPKCDGKCAGNECVCLMPQLTESFIQAYIKAYNEGKPITEVDLEMEENTKFKKPLASVYNSTRAILNNLDTTYTIKTRPDNTVIVHQSKMYSRDEVIKLIEKYHKAWVDRPIYDDDEDPPIPSNWIQDNLK